MATEGAEGCFAPPAVLFAAREEKLRVADRVHQRAQIVADPGVASSKGDDPSAISGIGVAKGSASLSRVAA